MKTPTPLPSQEYLRYNFYYNPETGKMYARFNKIHRKIGDEGTFRTTDGYLHFSIDNKKCLVHRLIYVYQTGIDPQGFDVDHKDRDKSNNKWENLRLATRPQNQRNRVGKGYHKVGKKWKAYIKTDYKMKYLGYYETEQEASDAYIQAKNELHGEFSPYQTN